VKRRAAIRCAAYSGLAIFLAAAVAAPVNAQEQPAEGTSAAPSNADANNPLAKFQAFNIHDYYTSSLTEMDDQNANTFWLQVFVGFNTQFVSK
jgi:hypothetical protein